MNAVKNKRSPSSQFIELSEEIEMRREFQNLLINKNLKIHFQPIVNLKSGQIYGYEGLTRTPQKCPFRSPIELFSYAEQCGSLYALEKTTRELAFGCSQSLIKNGEKLFINLNSQVIHDPDFTPGHTVSLLERYNLTPSDIVFEITERSAIHDFSAFREVLNHYRDQGFQIAVDDAGAGYSSLQAISEIMPDYIKVDRSLISDIHNNEVKAHILEAFVTFAKKMNSTVIAEGIENEHELNRVLELGIDCGQGYYLARPNFPVNNIPFAILDMIVAKGKKSLINNSIIVQSNDEIIIMENGKILKKSIVNRLI